MGITIYKRVYSPLYYALNVNTWPNPRIRFDSPIYTELKRKCNLFNVKLPNMHFTIRAYVMRTRIEHIQRYQFLC